MKTQCKIWKCETNTPLRLREYIDRDGAVVNHMSKQNGNIVQMFYLCYILVCALLQNGSILQTDVNHKWAKSERTCEKQRVQ